MSRRRPPNKFQSWPGLSRPSTPSCAAAKAWMPGTRPGMTVESQVRKLRHRYSSFMYFVEPWGSVAARRIPAGCRSKFCARTLRKPKRGKRSAEIRGRGTPHPLARPYDRTCPSSGRELPVHDADRRASRRSTAAFSFVLGTAFWKRTGVPIRAPLIPRAFTRFHPLHQPVAGRTHGGGGTN